MAAKRTHHGITEYDPKVKSQSPAQGKKKGRPKDVVLKIMLKAAEKDQRSPRARCERCGKMFLLVHMVCIRKQPFGEMYVDRFCYDRRSDQIAK